MSKATAFGPSNIAFVKYWGSRDPERVVPCNPSISMTLRACHSVCTAETMPAANGDTVEVVDGAGPRLAAGSFRDRILAQLDRLRAECESDASFRIRTRNSFPSAAGLASSASGFTALSLAVVGSLGVDPAPERLSELARISGSGSAARSAFGGYVRWPKGDDSLAAASLAGPDHWALCNVIAITDRGRKKVSSLEGHRRAPSSPHFAARLDSLPARLREVELSIRLRDLERLGPALEADAIELHLVAMSSRPPVFYWRPATVAVLEAVRALRDRGVAAWATMDAGPNVHVICPPDAADEVAVALGAVGGVLEVIRDAVGDGPRLIDEHLF